MWKDLDYVVQQVKAILVKEGWETLPGSGVLVEKGYSSLNTAVFAYHGGFPAFRKKLNEASGINPEKEQLETLLRKYVGG